MDRRTDGWTHRRDVGNSILDVAFEKNLSVKLDAKCLKNHVMNLSEKIRFMSTMPTYFT